MAPAVRQPLEHRLDDAPSPALALQPRQEVDVEVRRVRGEQPGIRAGGVVQPLDQGGVGRGGAAAARVALAQGREPDLVDPPLEGDGVGDGEAVAGHPAVVVQHARDGVGEGEVGPGPDVAEQVGVVVQGARVVAGVAGEQADPVDPGQVVQRAGPHRRHRAHASGGRGRAAVGQGRSVPP